MTCKVVACKIEWSISDIFRIVIGDRVLYFSWIRKDGKRKRGTKINVERNRRGGEI